MSVCTARIIATCTPAPTATLICTGGPTGSENGLARAKPCTHTSTTMVTGTPSATPGLYAPSWACRPSLTAVHKPSQTRSGAPAGGQKGQQHVLLQVPQPGRAASSAPSNAVTMHFDVPVGRPGQ